MLRSNRQHDIQYRVIDWFSFVLFLFVFIAKKVLNTGDTYKDRQRKPVDWIDHSEKRVVTQSIPKELKTNSISVEFEIKT